MNAETQPCRNDVETNAFYDTLSEFAPDAVERLAVEAIAEWPEANHASFSAANLNKRLCDHMSEPLDSEQTNDVFSLILVNHPDDAREHLINHINKRERIEYMFTAASNIKLDLDEKEAVEALDRVLQRMEANA